MPEAATQVSPLQECDFSPAPLRSDGEAGVRLEERAFMRHLNVRIPPSDSAAVQAAEATLALELPLAPNTVSSNRSSTVLWLGPDEWLIVVDRDAREPSLHTLEGALNPFFSAVNDVSGGQTVIRLSGDHAVDTLAKGCSLDLHPRVFGPGRCAQTQIAKTAAIICPLASNMPTYDLVVRRSFGDYLWRWLRSAAREYGIA